MALFTLSSALSSLLSDCLLSLQFSPCASTVESQIASTLYDDLLMVLH